MIVVDTSVVYALLDRRDNRHREARDWYESFAGELATTPLILAELDHLVAARAAGALQAFRADVAAGAYSVEWWAAAAAQSVEIAEQYRDLGLSLADASLVALAARLPTVTVATFDERRFRAVRPTHTAGGFTVVPADAGHG
ncbi:MAG: PIN domain-containing protein [Actinobacteria bacterium]|nr:PIN domain-containing protein [Actinomycetota bacterium]